MINWPKWVLRIIGILDVLFALFGLWLVETDIAHRPTHVGSNIFYEPQVFWGNATIDLACLIFLVLTGLAVIRLRPKGLWMTNVLFVIEIARFVAASEAFYLLVKHPGRHISPALAMLGTGPVQGTTPQIVTGFPLIAIIATNLAYLNLRQASGTGRSHPKLWKRVLLAIGALDLGFGVIGLVWAIFFLIGPIVDQTLIKNLGRATSDFPYVVQAYWAGVAFSAIFSLLLTLCGVAVLQLKRSGLWLTNALFTIEIAVFVAVGWAGLSNRHPSDLVANSILMVGTLAGPMWFQIVAAYPIISILATNAGYQKLRRNGLLAAQPAHAEDTP